MSQLIIGEGQNKALFLEFIQFCDNKPKDEVINHEGWDDCAVGQFFNTKSVAFIGYSQMPLVDTLLGSFKGSKQSLHWLVGSGICPSTFGEFTEFLKSYLPNINETV